MILADRTSASAVQTAVDFLVVQAYKAHDAVAELAEVGLAEDAATVTRRLLELGVQAVYIGADSEAPVCEARAGRYLAFLWRNMNPAAKRHVLGDARTYWEDIEATYGNGIPPKATRWGPTMREMFKYAEREDTYQEDYSLLSQIAHGLPEEFILYHGIERFPLRSTLHIPGILLFASRYYLGVVDVWNRHFALASEAEIKELASLLANDQDEDDDGDPPAI